MRTVVATESIRDGIRDARTDVAAALRFTLDSMSNSHVCAAAALVSQVRVTEPTERVNPLNFRCALY